MWYDVGSDEEAGGCSLSVWKRGTFPSITTCALLLKNGKWHVRFLLGMINFRDPFPMMLELNFDRSVAHVDQIHRLAWQSTDASTEKHLASCSDDGTLKILALQC